MSIVLLVLLYVAYHHQVPRFQSGAIFASKSKTNSGDHILMKVIKLFQFCFTTLFKYFMSK